MNLVYACVFFQEKYISMFELMYNSYVEHNRNNKNTHFLVITEEKFRDKLNKIMENKGIVYDIFVIKSKTFFDAAVSRVKVFKYPKINNYEKILYLDTDIIINISLFELFSIPIKDKLIAYKEVGHYVYHGCYLTNDEFKRNKGKYFSSGVLYFDHSCKKLFQEVYDYQQYVIREKLKISECLDQPIFNFLAIKKNMINNEALQDFVILNPKTYKDAKHINHFCGQVGNYTNKMEKMRNFLLEKEN